MGRKSRRLAIIIVLVLLAIVAAMWKLRLSPPSFTAIATQISWNPSGVLQITAAPPLGAEARGKQAVLSSFVIEKTGNTAQTAEILVNSLVGYPFVISDVGSAALTVGSIPSGLPALPLAAVWGRGTLRIKG